VQNCLKNTILMVLISGEGAFIVQSKDSWKIHIFEKVTKNEWILKTAPYVFPIYIRDELIVREKTREKVALSNI
jgi:hypothetical protein